MFDARPIQTQIKHKILEQYLGAWAGIIASKIHKAHFVYVDCFAGYGRYKGDQAKVEQGLPAEVVYGSPLIGIKALDALRTSHGAKITTSSILIEADKPTYQGLKECLIEQNYSPRIREIKNLKSLNLNDSEIALVNADSTYLVDELLAYTTTTQTYTFAFYFLDPFGPMGIPLENIRKIIRQQRHDVLINMPYQDLHKKTGYVEKNTGEATLQNYDAMYGNDGWQKIVKEMDSFPEGSQKSQEIELQLVNHYSNTLRAVDSGLSIKAMPLLFPDRQRTMFYLYLTTHDPTGSIQMNQILTDAGYMEQHLRSIFSYAKQTQLKHQMSLFSTTQVVPLPGKAERNFTQEIIEKLVAKFKGQTVTKKQIYQLLADDLYIPSDITKAFTQLRKDKLADFDGAASNLKHDDVIRFR